MVANPWHKLCVVHGEFCAFQTDAHDFKSKVCSFIDCLFSSQNKEKKVTEIIDQGAPNQMTIPLINYLEELEQYYCEPPCNETQNSVFL